MARTQLFFSLPPLYTFLYFLAPVHAQELDQNFCPTYLSVSATIYSPFVPWWAHYYTNQQCWSWASCIYIRADESRKQQFAATALVMGLIPLTFKDIAWPIRRVILLPKPLNTFLEVIVRALGIEPKCPTEREIDRKLDRKINREIDREINREIDREVVVRAWWMKSELARFIWGQAGIACTVAAVGVVLSSGALLVTELYSKRSALGCIYPAFVLSWFAIGLVPAVVHTLCSKMRRQREKRMYKAVFGNGAVVEEREVEAIISAPQVGEEWWIVQLIWVIFYIAGTLIVRYICFSGVLLDMLTLKQYTSIMAVTVIELLAWVLASAAMNASCKILAFSICLRADENIRPIRNQSFLLPTRAESLLRTARVMAEPDTFELLTRRANNVIERRNTA